MKWTYLLVNLGTIIIPLLFSFHPRIRFYQRWKYILPAIIITAIIFSIWDAAFTALNVWRFNPTYVTGISLSLLPLEELLFFICIPYACLFTYYCFDKFYELTWNEQREKIFCMVLSIVLMIVGFIFISRLYTSVTLISTALLCLLLKFIIRITWFGKSVTVYALVLVPFFIVNGILTGTGLVEPVVIYNNTENLGIRLLTIPIEDVFYGYELMLLNVWIMEMLERKWGKTKTSFH